MTSGNDNNEQLQEETNQPREELFARQEDPEPSCDLDVMIIGCGGMGAVTSIMLAISGMVRSFGLVDHDLYEKSNLNRIPLPPDVIGENKAIALRQHLKSLRPDHYFSDNLIVGAYPEKLTEDFELGDWRPDYIIFAADSPQAHDAVKVCLSEYIENRRCLFIAGDNDEIQIRFEPIHFMRNVDTGYTNVWAGSTFGGALSVVNALRWRMEQDSQELGTHYEVPVYWPKVHKKHHKMKREIKNLENTVESTRRANQRIVERNKDIQEVEDVAAD